MHLLLCILGSYVSRTLAKWLQWFNNLTSFHVEVLFRKLSVSYPLHRVDSRKHEDVTIANENRGSATYGRTNWCKNRNLNKLRLGTSLLSVFPEQSKVVRLNVLACWSGVRLPFPSLHLLTSEQHYYCLLICSDNSTLQVVVIYNKF